MNIVSPIFGKVMSVLNDGFHGFLRVTNLGFFGDETAKDSDESATDSEEPEGAAAFEYFDLKKS